MAAGKRKVGTSTRCDGTRLVALLDMVTARKLLRSLLVSHGCSPTVGHSYYAKIGQCEVESEEVRVER
jgi:hypothetical protein